MSIILTSPKDGSTIAHVCIAWGTKDAKDPRPNGVLIGLKAKDGDLDETRVVGGTTVVVKDRKGNEDKTRWVIHFELKHVKKGEYYRLRLFNPRALAATPPDQKTMFFDTLGCTNLKIVDAGKRIDRSKEGKPNFNGFLNLFGVSYPSSGSTPPASSMVAVGDLPGNEVDVDPNPNKTFIKCPDCGSGLSPTTMTQLSFSFPDGFGGYYAFFDNVDNGTGHMVSLHLTYVDQGLTDEVDNIMLS
jgi:hypothetical protein